MFGMSAATSARNVGASEPPVAGPAKIVFAVCVASVAVSVPVDVTGDPVTVKIAGIDNPTLVTAPAFVAVITPLEIEMPVPGVTFVIPMDPSKPSRLFAVGETTFDSHAVSLAFF
jgi:hypothetical protein